MGSAVLGEAIGAIRDWSEKRGKEMSAPNGKGAFGSLVFNDAEQQKRLPKKVYDALRRTITRGESLDPSDRRRRRDRAEGLGDRKRRHPLHALVPAADRHHGREARLVPRTGHRRQGGLRVLRQGAGQGRARCVELPVGRHALDVRSARLHGVGSDQPALAAEERQRRRRSSFRPRSSAGPARRSTRRRRCCARWKRCRSRRFAC